MALVRLPHEVQVVDVRRIRGRLDLMAAGKPADAAAARARPERAPALAAQWDERVGRLPADWSDLYAEVELDSSDFLQRGVGRT